MRKILIVDDTKSWQIFHLEVIKQLYGDLFEITVADNAQKALNEIKYKINNPFDIIITDLQMETDFEPKLAGEWLVENIKSLPEYSISKIIIISAMPNIEFIAQKYNVECISKNLLIRNRLLIKFMLEKLMPFLTML